MHCCEPQCLCCCCLQIQSSKCIAFQWATDYEDLQCSVGVPQCLCCCPLQIQNNKCMASQSTTDHRGLQCIVCTSVSVLLSFADPKQQVRGLPVHNGLQGHRLHCLPHCRQHRHRQWLRSVAFLLLPHHVHSSLLGVGNPDVQRPSV